MYLFLLLTDFMLHVMLSATSKPQLSGGFFTVDQVYTKFQY